MTLDELFLILGVIMLSSGVVMAFRSSSSGVAFSYIGVSALSHSRYAVFNEEVLVFWAIAAVIVVVIDLVKRGFGHYPNLWKNYIVGGALAGMAVGLVYGSSGVSIGAIAGAVLGGLACRRVGGGSWELGRQGVLESGSCCGASGGGYYDDCGDRHHRTDAEIIGGLIIGNY